MNRGNFFKSLVTLLAAPSIISEIDWGKTERNKQYEENKKLAQSLCVNKYFEFSYSYQYLDKK